MEVQTFDERRDVDFAKDGSADRGTWLLIAAVVLLLITLLAGGCSSSPAQTVAVERVTPNEQVVQRGLEQACADIAAGDLDAAEVMLQDLAPVAFDHVQKRQIQSLMLLIDGSRAMMAGDGALARELWSSIPDPYLQRAVRMAASDMDVDVPMLASRHDGQ